MQPYALDSTTANFRTSPPSRWMAGPPAAEPSSLASGNTGSSASHERHDRRCNHHSNHSGGHAKSPEIDPAKDHSHRNSVADCRGVEHSPYSSSWLRWSPSGFLLASSGHHVHCRRNAYSPTAASRRSGRHQSNIRRLPGITSHGRQSSQVLKLCASPDLATTTAQPKDSLRVVRHGKMTDASLCLCRLCLAPFLYA